MYKMAILNKKVLSCRTPAYGADFVDFDIFHLPLEIPTAKLPINETNSAELKALYERCAPFVNSALREAFGVSKKSTETLRYVHIQLRDQKGSFPPIVAGVKGEMYSVFGGGKQLRPLFALASVLLTPGANLEDDSHQKFIAAIELLHTYTLIHDDIMDNDDLRRGRPTNHVVYDVNSAILHGDALQARAYNTVLGSKADSKRVIKAAQYFGTSAEDVIQGQQLDISGEEGGYLKHCEATGKSPEDYLLEMHRLKTGALFKAAVVIPQILIGADDAIIGLSEKLAENLGILFQIIDDILDVLSNPEIMKKSTGKDHRDQKCTYVEIFGLEDSLEKAFDCHQRTCLQLEVLQKMGANVSSMRVLIDAVLNQLNTKVDPEKVRYV
jgi:geranylgeranyl diphosphate synthase, type II